MLSKSTPRLLRYVLWADAISCLACGSLQVAFVGTLKHWLGVPAAMLIGTGQFLLIYGAAVAFLATRIRVPGAIIWFLIAGNSIWAVACLAILVGGDFDLTPLGNAYVIIQAFTVAALAQLQYLGLRQSKLQLSV
jgi:hypothetical protein